VGFRIVDGRPVEYARGYPLFEEVPLKEHDARSDLGVTPVSGGFHRLVAAVDEDYLLPRLKRR